MIRWLTAAALVALVAGRAFGQTYPIRVGGVDKIIVKPDSMNVYPTFRPTYDINQRHRLTAFSNSWLNPNGHGFHMQVKDGTGGGVYSVFGTITNQKFALATNNVFRWFVEDSTSSTFRGAFVPMIDNAYDIGSANQSRWVRDIYAKGTLYDVTYNGDPITVPFGGSGAETLTGVVMGNGASAMTANNSTTVGQVYCVGSGPTIGWGAVDLADADAVTGLLPQANVLNANLAGTSNQISLSASGTDALVGSTNITLSLPQDHHTGAVLQYARLGLGIAADASAVLNLPTGGTIEVNSTVPFRTLILSGGGGAPTTTIGCGGPTKVEAGTNDIDYWVLEFDASTEERAFWAVQMPDNYDGGTVTAIFTWTNAAGTSSQGVVWGIKARSYADDEAIDQAYGTEVTVTDTWLAQSDVHISAASSAITIGGTPAGGEWVVFNVGRKTANGSDTMTGDARLLAVKIEYAISAYSD